MSHRAPVFFVTSKHPFPPDDGQKIPVANYFRVAESKGLSPEVIVVEMKPDSGGLGRMSEMVSRINPFSGFFTNEQLSDAAIEKLMSIGDAIVFVQPLRLFPMVLEIKKQNPRLQIIVLNNDAKWPQYWEELLYGLGIRKGGTFNDLIKGLSTPITYLKERLGAYRGADIIALQCERERKRLPWISNRTVIAMNALSKPTQVWHGHDSPTFAMQVNLANRRGPKFRPFVERVWPLVHERAPYLHLELFGPGKTTPNWVEKTPNVRFVGLVDDVHDYLADKRGLVMPLEHDTGVSNTVLHGLALDMPMITSLHSTRGVAHLSYSTPPVYVANRPQEYVNGILEASSLSHSAHPRAIGSWTDNFDVMMAALRQAE